MPTYEEVAQLHGNMETIDIYSIDLSDHDAANQFEVKRHLAGLTRLGIPCLS